MNKPLHFSTKAQTLASLQPVLQTAHILPLCFFSVAQWKRDASDCLRKVVEQNSSGLRWIVRSSCGREDGSTSSNAGAFLSVLNVAYPDLKNAVEQVIAAYGQEVQDSDEVLIQPMLKNVIRSGVAFTHDPNTCAPYRVINWSEGDDTAAVTGGGLSRVWQQAARIPCYVAQRGDFIGIIRLLEELETLFGNIPIDCEFAVTREVSESGSVGEQLWLLQARPLILARPPESAEQQQERLLEIERKVVRGMKAHPFLKGKRTVYGVMPDWNPAEIVGIRPKPLALSLYRDLVTDAVWAYQRHNYGYRNLRSFPLMPHFFGLPYIDVRLSFNSFIPEDLDDNLAGRLVDYYIDRLLSEPALHDKVEFEIVFSCYTFDLPSRLDCLKNIGFSSQERRIFTDSLRNLTNRIVDPQKGLWRTDASKLNVLADRRKELLSSTTDPLEQIYWLLEDAKRYGTLPFAGLARAGFVAVQMLKSLVSVGVFSEQDYEAFIGSISTVSRQLARDRTVLDKRSFLSHYGHLRPGTYDILSPRYDEAPDLYFDWSHRPPVPEETKPFTLTLPQMRDIASLLEEHNLQANPVGLFDFMQAGIELRELAKFHFTRNLSDALSLMAKVGEKYGFSQEDLAYCDIAAFTELHIAAVNPKEVLLRSIEQGKARYAETLKVSLPPLIVQPTDIWAFEWPETSPNFITQKQVVAPVVSCNDRDKLAGSIVCIQNADPGFDWLFSYPIAGLVTAWGGANSHMAIRAGELGLPAVIGAGEVLYRRWSSAQRLRLDCAGRNVEVLA